MCSLNINDVFEVQCYPDPVLSLNEDTIEHYTQDAYLIEYKPKQKLTYVITAFSEDNGLIIKDYYNHNKPIVWKLYIGKYNKTYYYNTKIHLYIPIIVKMIWKYNRHPTLLAHTHCNEHNTTYLQYKTSESQKPSSHPQYITNPCQQIY
jgi:hypothetical protein